MNQLNTEWASISSVFSCTDWLSDETVLPKEQWVWGLLPFFLPELHR